MGKIKDVRDKMVSLFRTQRRRDKELLRKFSQDVSKKTLEDVSEYCEFVADGNVELASKMKLEVANILDNGKNAKETIAEVAKHLEEASWRRYMLDSRSAREEMIKAANWMEALTIGVTKDMVDVCNKKGFLNLSYDQCEELAINGAFKKYITTHEQVELIQKSKEFNGLVDIDEKDNSVKVRKTALKVKENLRDRSTQNKDILLGREM